MRSRRSSKPILPRRLSRAAIRKQRGARLGQSVRQRQQSHDVRVVGWLDSLRADVVFGWRQLKRNKVTSAAAILSLALAIGACTAAFRLIDALLLRPLPVAHPERLYVLSRQGMGFDNKPGSLGFLGISGFSTDACRCKGAG